MSELSLLFPTVAQVAAEFPAPVYLAQRHYLIDGELCHWSGELAEVLSPVQIRDETSGDIAPVRLGATPLLDSAAALTALDAAVG